MLSQADARLVRSDPAIPALAMLLDAEAFAGALQDALPEVAIREASCSYLRYKAATRCLAAYRVATERGDVTLYATAHGSDAPVKLAKAAERRVAPSILGPGRLLLAERGLVVWLLPNDPRLRRLRRLDAGAEEAKLVQAVAPALHWRPEQPHTRLAYKPERRYAAALHGADGRRLVLKLHARASHAGRASRARGVQSRGPLRVARLLGFAPELGALAHEWLDGDLLRERIRAGDVGSDALRCTGAALALLHGQDVRHLRAHTPASGDAVRAMARDLGRLLPEKRRRLAALAERIAARLETGPADAVVHGDFYAKQVLVDGSTAALLDLDEIARGDAAEDLGCFLAHLERDAESGLLGPERLSSLRGWLLEGYAGVAPPPDEQRIDLHVAANLLLLASHPFREREPDWPGRVEALLARCAAVLERALPALPVAKPGPAVEDAALPFLTKALDPAHMQSRLRDALPEPQLAGARLRQVCVLGHRSGRRAVLEYRLAAGAGDAAEDVRVVAKLRARSADTRTQHLLDRLRSAGFGADSSDGISVPEPLAVLPELHMTLQRAVPGAAADSALQASPSAAGLSGVALAQRVAEAVAKLQRCGVRPPRSHTLGDELRILGGALEGVAGERPAWSARLERLFEACCRLAGTLPGEAPVACHRDLHPGQILVDAERIHLLDLDLYALGDPGLDAGNFAAHLSELALRSRGDARALEPCERALEERLVALLGERVRVSLRGYALLSLCRHLQISRRIPQRRWLTPALLELCEERLAPWAAPAARAAGGS